jgi:phenylalanyl-tRNA synthetase beta chain
MRQTLLLGGLETVIYNHNRKNFDLELYEFGAIYALDNSKKNTPDVLAKYTERKHLSIFLTGKANNESWREERKNIDFFDLKHFVSNILKRLNLDMDGMDVETISNDILESGLRYGKNNKTLVNFGLLKANILNFFEIRQDVFYADFDWDAIVDLMKSHKISYTEVPKFPRVRRDLALLLDKNIQFEDSKKLAFKTEKNILKEVSLFDVYEGDNIEKGKKSYALSFILQDERKTLTDKVIDKPMRRLQNVYEREIKAVIR